jgi:hypothetical protein
MDATIRISVTTIIISRREKPLGAGSGLGVVSAGQRAD